MTSAKQNDIPAAAACTEDYDISLLTFEGSYCSQIVRLCAAEKGIRWKNYDIDIVDKLDQFLPWYLLANPKAVVPTMLVGVENKPVCDSAYIIEYIDEHFDGKVKL